MGKKFKNLTSQDIEDVSIYEMQPEKRGINQNNIDISDIQIKVKCLNEKQKEFKKLIEDKEVVICNAPSGTGKTYFSLLMALHLLKTEPKYKKIVLIKSLEVVKGQELGHLKGTLEEKLLPYNFSFIGNLDKIFNSKVTTKLLMNSGIIDLLPIAYTRGVTLDQSIVITDEIQNISMDIFKTILTRIGSDSKMIFLGDSGQCDLTNKKSSCMNTVMNLFKHSGIVGTIEFTEEDCVRNPIIPKILHILDNYKKES